MVPFADCVNHENVDVTYEQVFAGSEAPPTAKVAVRTEEDDWDNSSGCASANESDNEMYEDAVMGPKSEVEKAGEGGEEKKEDVSERKVCITKIGESLMQDKKKDEETKQSHKAGAEDEFAELERSLEGRKDDYTFLLKTGNERQFYAQNLNGRFAKGSQVHLTYGKLSNRQLLLHYGFCLEKNKYNYGYFKLGLEPSGDREEDMRKLDLVAEASGDAPRGQKRSLKRKFKLYFQQFNSCIHSDNTKKLTAVVTFVKILHSKPGDPKDALLSPLSLDKERQALLYLVEIYGQFLKQKYPLLAPPPIVSPPHSTRTGSSSKARCPRLGPTSRSDIGPS